MPWPQIRVAGHFDPVSVATTQQVLSNSGLSVPWCVEIRSVFNLAPEKEDVFDIVYSWGVLHHTGDMWKAIDRAASMVAPGGLLVLALYRKTYPDAFWRAEKLIYSRAPEFIRSVIRTSYVAAFRLAMAASGRSFKAYVSNYKSARGMDYYKDVHDWLGGYPYESAEPAEVEQKLAALGFAAERIFIRPTDFGFFGSGCDEFVFRKRS